MADEKKVADLAGRVTQLKAQTKEKIRSFTLEAGRGTTYAHGKPTLYAHGTYPRGSVLAGQSLRKWVEQWDDWAEARADLAAVKKAAKGFKFEDWGPKGDDGPTGATTHVPIEQMVAHLPDDTDY